MISDQYKCIFIHVPKCAGNSINRALTGKVFMNFDKKQRIWLQHATAQQTKNFYTTKEQWDNYFKFTIVRNPFDRIFSSYSRIMRGKKFATNCSFKDFVFRQGPFEDLFSEKKYHERSNLYHQVMPIYNYLYDDSGNLLVDYIAKFENLENEWDFLSRKLGVSSELSHLNPTKRKIELPEKLYRKHYDQEMKSYVEKYYSKDLELFEYDF